MINLKTITAATIQRRTPSTLRENEKLLEFVYSKTQFWQRIRVWWHTQTHTCVWLYDVCIRRFFFVFVDQILSRFWSTRGYNRRHLLKVPNCMTEPGPMLLRRKLLTTQPRLHYIFLSTYIDLSSSDIWYLYTLSNGSFGILWKDF